MSTDGEKYTKSKIRADEVGEYLFATSVGGCRMEEGEFIMAQIRGWGHLQYHGESEAVEIQLDNIRRLAACWNAAQGVPTATLEKLDDGQLATLLGVQS